MRADRPSVSRGPRPHGVGRRDQRTHPAAGAPVLALADTDREVVARVRAGDEDAFAHLFRTHHASLCTYAFRLVGDAEAAQDLVQSGMLRVWQHRARWELRPEGTVRAYLYAVVRNVALQHCQHERIVHRICDGSVARGDAIAMGQGTGSADDRLATRDLQAALTEALETLPPRCREAFILRRAVGLPVAEVARVMGIAPKTVEVQIGAALRALRAQLRDWTGWSPKRPDAKARQPPLTRI
jgi:RNA polymerase sigma-70 factor (family 1)